MVRWASCFRASSSSICLISMASSVSFASCVGAGYVYVGPVFGYVGIDVVALSGATVSLPLAVCNFFGVGRVNTWPLDVG
jgi:hypothetical protein